MISHNGYPIILQATVDDVTSQSRMDISDSPEAQEHADPQLMISSTFDGMCLEINKR